MSRSRARAAFLRGTLTRSARWFAGLAVGAALPFLLVALLQGAPRHPVQAPHATPAAITVTSTCKGNVRQWHQTVDGDTVHGAFEDPTCPDFTD